MRIAAQLFLFLLVANLFPRGAQAQDPTAAAVVSAANAVLTKIQNVGTALTGNASIAVGGANTQVSGLLSQFERAVGENINAPLSSLGLDARILGTQLMETTAVLDALVSRQRECIFQNLDLFLSGIQTVSADLATQVPFVSPQQPRISKFQFDGKLTPNVVPEAGGRVTMTGYRFWENGTSPQISLWDAGRHNKLLDATPGEAGSSHAVSFVVSPTIIQTHSGECLQVNIKTFSTRRKWVVLRESYQTGNLYMPMCIPAAYGTKIGMEARVDYTVNTPGRRTLSTKRYGFVNTDMVHGINVSETKRWDDEIPSGWRIVEAPHNVVRKENDSNIGISFDDRAVTAAGHLSDAEDFNPPIGPRIRVDDTEWHADVTPIIAGSDVSHRNTSAQHPLVDLATPTTRMCVDLEVEGTPDPVSTYQIRVFQETRGEGGILPIYDGQRLTTNANTHTHQEDIGGFRLVTTYNPTVVAGNKTQACATVTSTGQCAF